MSKREQVILIITVIVAIIGVYIMFFDTSTRQTSTQNDTPMDINELQKLVNNMSDKVNQDDLSDKDAYVIEMATSQWEHDPFSDIVVPDQSEKKATPKEEIKMTYSGFVQIGSKLLAVINGIEYQAGEELAQPGYVIDNITPEKVVIKVGNRKTISLPLEETM
ncbi:MAG: hypothetical protein KJ737_10330 [Proteobacteria bacterium]|nr:hypothetical protein [Pseudomonadota bacterium]